VVFNQLFSKANKNIDLVSALKQTRKKPQAIFIPWFDSETGVITIHL
jgi:hypothetical protein